MSKLNTTTLIPYILIFCTIFIVPPCLAQISEDVTHAMKRANNCKQAGQNQAYSECMQANSKQIRKIIQQESSRQMATLSNGKKQTIRKNINKKIKSFTEQCLIENGQFNGSMSGERRHPYCIYENMLELLINVQRNIDIYAH